MKIENTNYALMRIGDMEFHKETAYLTKNHEFTNDIREAIIAGNRAAALWHKHTYEIEKCNNHECDLLILPVKITYEW